MLPENESAPSFPCLGKLGKFQSSQQPRGTMTVRLLLVPETSRWLLLFTFSRGQSPFPTPSLQVSQGLKVQKGSRTQDRSPRAVPAITMSVFPASASCGFPLSPSHTSARILPQPFKLHPYQRANLRLRRILFRIRSTCPANEGATRPPLWGHTTFSPTPHHRHD